MNFKINDIVEVVSDGSVMGIGVCDDGGIRGIVISFQLY